MASRRATWGRVLLFLVAGLGMTAAAPPRAALGQVAVPAPAPSMVALAHTSRLPYPAGADRWVDALGAAQVSVSIPGAGVTVIRRQAVLVFRPTGDRMRWEDLEAMYAGAGLLPPGAMPRLAMLKVPEGEVTPGANAFEDRVYRTRIPGEHLVLGLIRNLKSQNLLVYGVLLSSKLEDAQALMYARGAVEKLAEEARLQRLQLPPPPGAVAAAGVIRLQGVQLRQLQRSLLSDATLSPAVKRIAEVVLPQATAVTRRVWRTKGALADKAFFEHYAAQARARGWSAALSQDETSPGRPTLLFQRPYNSGVVLLRAQPATDTRPEALLQPTTTIFQFEMEGAINVSTLAQ